MTKFDYLLIVSIVASYFACFGSLFLTAWVRSYAERHGFVDRPDGRRKKHKLPVALGGGVAVLLSCAVALGLVAHIYLGIAPEEIVGPESLLGLSCAAVLLCAVGLYDDAYNMRGVYKLIWQLVAASLIVGGGGLSIEKIELFGVIWPIGFFGIPLAMLWIVAAVNSLNLIDGMDGLATTVGFVFSVTIGVMALTDHRNLDAVIAFTMAGALLGFLRHNWPPAKIYLGDSGSMLIGVVLGTLALRCQFKEAATLAVAAPLAIWAIPMLDSVAALARRKLTGRSMYVTDRGHIHHRLLTRGLSNRQALYLITALCLVTSAGAIASALYDTPAYSVISFGLVILLLVGTRIFGHAELMLLNNQLLGFGRLLLQGESPRASSVRLQGVLQWEEAWEGLVEAAERFNLIKIRLNLYLPQIHEDFFATWHQRSPSRSARRWSMEIPLTVEDEVAGFLYVSGVQESGSTSRLIADFAELIEPLESQLAEIAAAHREGVDKASQTVVESAGDTIRSDDQRVKDEDHDQPASQETSVSHSTNALVE